MKKILIIAPQFPPSNLAAVHRSRLFAQHLSRYGWQPSVLTVQEKYYEETLDHNLTGLLSPGLNVRRVTAFPVTRPRMIGDIGLRAFFQLYREAKKWIREEKFDFLYIPIPPFYTALLGRWLHRSTGIKYGIDYIDPWVHRFPGSDKVGSRHWFSTRLAAFLEPIAIKKASLITGVAEGYYKAVRERNPGLAASCIFGAMPYGGEQADHEKVQSLGIQPYLFPAKTNKIRLVYAGAMLPKAYGPLERIFGGLKQDTAAQQQLEIHFIGTGKTPNDPEGYNVRPLAEQYGLWNRVVFEHPRRIPYLDVLVHLEAADGVFILGSTEPHYTPSKVYQGVLSGKPLLAVLHQESTAVAVIRQSGAGLVLGFDGEEGLERIGREFAPLLSEYLLFMKKFDPKSVNMEIFDQYSAERVTGELASLVNLALEKN